MSFCVRYRVGDSVWNILSLTGSEQQNPKDQAQRDVTAEGQQELCGPLTVSRSLQVVPARLGESPGCTTGFLQNEQWPGH